MDKFEYKVHLTEIKGLIKEREFDEASLIADTIDWRRVKSPTVLCMISDLYKLVGRFEDSRNIMEMAYERQPGSRSVIFALCELSVKLGDVGQATLYYQEFSQLFPNDPGKYKLLYKLYVAQDVSMEERIAVLEEYQRQEKDEKWMYELAMLYHRAGQEQKCVDQCDMICTWFGESRYRAKALSLKGQHTSLNEVEQAIAEGRELSSSMPTRMFTDRDLAAEKASIMAREANAYQEEAQVPQQEYYQEEPVQEEVFQREPVQAEIPSPAPAPRKTGNTGPLVPDFMGMTPAVDFGAINNPESAIPEAAYAEEPAQTRVFERIPESRLREPVSQAAPQPAPRIPDFMTDTQTEIRVKTIDDNPFSTINLQSNMEQELAKNLEEVLGTPVGEVLDRYGSGEIPPLSARTPAVKDISGFGQDRVRRGVSPEASQGTRTDMGPISSIPATPGLSRAITGSNAEVNGYQPSSVRRRPAATGFDNMISQEGDGQLQFVMPDKASVEKQITGQLGISDVLQDWERKRQSDQAAYRKRIEDQLRFQTGEILAKFEEEVDIRPAAVELSELQAVQDAFNLADQRKSRATEEELIRVVPEPLKTVPASGAKTGEEEAEVKADPYATSELPVIPETPLQQEKAPLTDEEALKASVEEVLAEKEKAAVQPVEEAAPEISAEAEPAAVESVAAEAPLPETAPEPERAPAGPMEAEAEMAEEAPVAAPAPAPVEMTEEELRSEISEEEALAMRQNTQSDLGKVLEKGLRKVLTEEGDQGHHGQSRPLSPEERALFGAFIQDSKSRNQMVDALEKISMASYTGNVILTGDIEKDNDTLAKNIMKYLSSDGNFSGKMAKVSGEAFNSKDPMKVVEKLSAGELYITGASKLTSETIQKLHKALNRAECAIVVVLGDRRKAMEKLLETNPILAECFNARIDIQNLNDKELAKFAKVYAREREYSIDAMGMLALLTKIEDNQRNDHAVSVGEVRDMVDEAIRRASGISPVHFIDIVTQRRYDEEDRIILKERDFAF